jgi:hypothetical protein
MNINAPVELINILRNWYSKSFSFVKWGNILSEPFTLISGVRQGGVLSHQLFAVYVNDILVKLANHGYLLNGHSVGGFMYADDLILLSPSISELQQLWSIFAGLNFVI